MILLWSLVFIVSMAVLVKGADWLIASAEKIGLSMGLSPFIVGVTIVGMGTSFPELISSLAATTRGVTDVVVANAKDFADLSVADQKKFLIECLDKNQLYVNLSEIEDKEYGVSKEDIKLNKEFYE